MPYLTCKVSKFVFDRKAYSNAFNKALRQLFKKAGQAFLSAAIAKIPFRTGFVRGAFTPMAEALGVKGAAPGGVSDVIRAKSLTKKIEKTTKELQEIKALRESRKPQKRDKVNREINKVLKKKETILTARLKKLQKAFTKATSKKRDIKFILGLAGQGDTDREALKNKQPTAGKDQKTPLIYDKSAESRTTRNPEFLEHEKKPVTERLPIPAIEFYKPDRGKGTTRYLKTLRSGAQFASFQPFEEESTQAKKTGATTLDQIFKNDSEIQNNYNFTFLIDITYFNINDQFSNPHTPSAPWKSFAAGRNAFYEVMSAGLSKLPDVLSYLIETEIRLNANGTVTRKTKNLVI